MTVLYPRRGVSELVRFTPAEVQERYGLTPAQYPDFAVQSHRGQLAGSA